VEALDLRAGDAVLDVACGTGLNLPYIEKRIGPTGSVVGVDLSPHMLDRARRRVAQAGWENVTLVYAPAEEADFPGAVDAVLLCAAHDVMRSPRALANIAGRLRPGGRLVAAGCKWAPWWSLPLNLGMWVANRPFVTTFEGFDQPWSHLVDLLPDLRVQDVAAGCGYIARGTAPAPAPARQRRRATAQRRGGAPTEKL
jgi:demethylmenaquinone methyltransferase/2-methoxy-6-polyprenyl-1,4-benzoquinol methylase